MKKLVMIALFCAVLNNTVYAQENNEPKAAVQFSFLPFVGTNGMKSFEYTNCVSINLLAGVSKNETAFTFGGLGNIIKNNATGFQFAGLANYVGNEGKGVLFSGLTNYVRNDYCGFQFGGLANFSGDFKGVQFGGLFNRTKSVTGIQFGGLMNLADGKGCGLQFGGLANVVRGDYRGLQFGGLFNTAKDVKGVQFSGLVSVAKDVNGAQFSGLVNVAKDVNGAQFSGLVNVAKNVEGAQLAGILNIAENSDCPIGLVNIIKNGEKGIGVTYDILGNAMVSFRSGGKYTYGILGVGYNHKVNGKGMVVEGGIGANIMTGLSWFRIRNELKVSSIGCGSDEMTLNGGYALLPAFKIGKHFELFGGPSINYLTSSDPENFHLFKGKTLWNKQTGSRSQQLYVGYQVGVHYIF